MRYIRLTVLLSDIFQMLKVSNYMKEGRQEGIGFYVAFNSLGHIAKRNSLLFTNSSKGSFCCRRIIGIPPQRRTFI